MPSEMVAPPVPAGWHDRTMPRPPRDPSTAPVGQHLEAALGHLDVDDLLDRLLNPRHTDHDLHVFVPAKLAAQVALARREIQAAIELLAKSAT